MSKCRYELSTDCNNTDCLKCVLNKIRAEIEQMPSELTTDGRRMIRRGSVFRIIEKYRKGVKNERFN